MADDEEPSSSSQDTSPRVDWTDALLGDAFDRLDGVIAHAVQAFDTPDQAETWLWSPNPALGDRIPIVEARTQAGAWDVHAVLGRSEHGVFG